MSANGSVTVGELLPVLRQWQVRLLAGERGLSRSVSWASSMRARLPAFESFQGGELALLSLATLRALRSQLVAFSLPAMVEQLADMGASAIVVAGLDGALSPQDSASLEEAKSRAQARDIPLLALPVGTSLDKIENAVIAYLRARRERQLAPRSPADPLAAQLRASLRGEALDALLSGTYAGEPQMRSRAAQLGHDLAHPYIALWVELDASAATAASAPSSTTLTAAETTPLAAQLAEELERSLSAWTHARGSQVVALAPQGKLERGPLDLAERAHTLLRRLTSTSPDARGENGARRRETQPATSQSAAKDAQSAAWTAGVGESAIGPAQLRRSASEAHDAARLGFLMLGPGHVARISDLGVYQLLLALREGGTLEAFARRTLAPFDADPKDREQYFATLEAYFACHGNATKAAEQLHLHRNSLLYRLANIRDLLQRDLDDPELRLALQLALKARRVLDLS